MGPRATRIAEPDWVRERKAAGMPGGERRRIAHIAALFVCVPVVMLSAFFGVLFLFLWLVLTF